MLEESDAEREQRIHDEIIVDCYDEHEQISGWYCYLEDNLEFPFVGMCIAERAVSPLKVGDEVAVVGMAPMRECEHGEMFVWVNLGKRKLAVPLVQLEPVEAEDKTIEAVFDWHYWSGAGSVDDDG